MGTGAVSTRPPIGGLTGADALGPADDVHLLHSMGDTFAVMDSLEQRDPKTAVIIGAGLAPAPRSDLHRCTKRGRSFTLPLEK